MTALDLLDAAYDERLRALERIRAAAASLHASRARLESASRTWIAAVKRHEQRAREALAAGDETAARVAAAACVPIDGDIEAAAVQRERYLATERTLAAARDIVTGQLDSVRRRRESLGGVQSGAAAMDRLRAELAALATEYEPVERALGSTQP